MKRANPAVIGGFIIGMVVLAIAVVMILGSDRLFTETVQCVMYFEGSVDGLSLGAPVKFRGVKVGSVTSITMLADPQIFAVRIPVVVEFPMGTRGAVKATNANRRSPQDSLANLIEMGLRAQFQTNSLITGQLFIQLDLTPWQTPRKATIDPNTKLIEIPTVPTTLQEVNTTIRRVLDTLADVPLEEMRHSVEGTLLGINRLVNAPELIEAIHHLAVSATTALGSLNKAATEIQQLVQQTQQLVQQTQQLVQQVDKQLEQVASSVATTIGQVSQLTQTVHTQALSLTTDLRETATGALNAIERLRETLRPSNSSPPVP